jgi:hypothetical protein
MMVSLSGGTGLALVLFIRSWYEHKPEYERKVAGVRARYWNAAESKGRQIDLQEILEPGLQNALHHSGVCRGQIRVFTC